MSVFPSLDARLAWAAQHIARLRSLVDAYQRARPYTVVEELADEGATRIVRATLTSGPPAAISLALGDVAHQLRAVLDNAVGALREGGPTGRSAFVITADPETFDRACRDGRLTGLPPAVLEVVRSVQPFAGPPYGSWIGSGLEVLDALAQHDRHRAVLLGAGFVRAWAVEVVRPVPASPADLPPIEFTGPAEVRFPARALAIPTFEIRVFLAEGDERIRDREVMALVDLIAHRTTFVVQRMEHAALRD